MIAFLSHKEQENIVNLLLVVFGRYFLFSGANEDTYILYVYHKDGTEIIKLGETYELIMKNINILLREKKLLELTKK